MEDMFWHSIDGSTLREAYEDGALAALLPSKAGIYAWKLNPLPRTFLLGDYKALMSHINELLVAPQGEVTNKRINHSLFLERLVMTGKPLEGNKYDSLESWLKDRENMSWMLAYLRNLSEMLPPIYVGQSSNLHNRVKQHLSAANGFGLRVSEEKDLNWDKVILHWSQLPDNSDSVITSLEFMLQSMSVSSFTQRVG